MIRQTSYLFVSLRASETTVPALKMIKSINSDGPNIRSVLSKSQFDAALDKIRKSKNTADATIVGNINNNVVSGGQWSVFPPHQERVNYAYLLPIHRQHYILN